jgi:two-component system response regulator AtoC
MARARSTEFVDIRNLPPIDVIFGQSSMMALARQKLERTANSTVPILLQGESGTGKDILAKLMHARSTRSKAPWVKVACPAIPHSLIESELFGYERGAFTGAYTTKRGRLELAHLGTLFLDEVGSLDLSVQAKLLQVLQDGSFMRVGAQDGRPRMAASGWTSSTASMPLPSTCRRYASEPPTFPRWPIIFWRFTRRGIDSTRNRFRARSYA